MSTTTKQEIISSLFKQGILVTPTILQQIENGATLQEIIGGRQPAHTQHIQQPAQNIPNQSKSSITNTLTLDENGRAPVNITFEYKEDPKQYSVDDFVTLFNKRLDIISGLLRTHTELGGVTSIRRLQDLPTDQRKNVSIIGYVYKKGISKNGHIILDIEDKTGFAKVIINKDRAEIFSVGEQIILDDIIGIIGTLGESKDNVIYANTIVFPDVPLKEMKKSPFPVRAAFTSDLHFGAKMFMTEAFDNFIRWINGETTTGKEREEVMHIKYLFLVGDLVEGVGVYPGQENDLSILDIEKQYEALTKELLKIRKDIQIIACGGNHDAMRIAEPQPKFYEKYSKSLYTIPNFTAVSSPSIVNIGKTESFGGFDVLMYHGFSFPYYFDGVDYLRKQGGVNRIDLVMEFLLKRRHLAPTHTSTQYIPDPRDDFLAIKKVPDFFVTGHVHKIVTKNYKNVTMLNCSAWFGETDYMIKRGIIADPAKVIIADLQTREIIVKDFDNRKELEAREAEEKAAKTAAEQKLKEEKESLTIKH